MPPGRAMDLLIERDVVGGFVAGFPTGQPVDVARYSTDDQAASELLARLTAGKAPSADFGVYCDGECEATIAGARATASSLALAICRAALLANLRS